MRLLRRLGLAVVILATGLVATPRSALATVTSSTKTVQYTGTGTSVFSIPYYFLLASDLRVTKTLISNSSNTILVQGVDYTVTMPVGSTLGSITTTVAVTSSFRITIDRVMQLTQPTAFRTQGPFRAASVEDAVDRLTMIAQQLQSGSGATVTQTDIDNSINAHVGAADPHTGYALLLGRSGGQHLRGGTGAGNNLQLTPTSNGTHGKILLGLAGASAFDDVNGRLGIGTAAPSYTLDINGTARFGTITYWDASGDQYKTTTNSHLYLSEALDVSGISNNPGILMWGLTATPSNRIDIRAGTINFTDELGNVRFLLDSTGFTNSFSTAIKLTGVGAYVMAPTFYGTTTVGGNSAWSSTNSGTKGFLQFGIAGSAGAIDETNKRLGIGTATPAVALDIVGAGQFTSTFTGLKKMIAGGASYTVVAPTDCAGTVTTSTDGSVIQLPKAAAGNSGCEITIVNTAASATAALSIRPNVADGIFGSCTGSTYVVLTGTVGKDLQNLKPTSTKWNLATLLSDGSSGWGTTDCVGTWQSQP